MSVFRYSLTCRECGLIESDTSEDGLFDEPTAHRRAGVHEGTYNHTVTVDIAEETNEYRCPVCHTKCIGEQERDEHAKTEPGVPPGTFVRV